MVRWTSGTYINRVYGSLITLLLCDVVFRGKGELSLLHFSKGTIIKFIWFVEWAWIGVKSNFDGSFIRRVYVCVCVYFFFGRVYLYHSMFIFPILSFHIIDTTPLDVCVYCHSPPNAKHSKRWRYKKRRENERNDNILYAHEAKYLPDSLLEYDWLHCKMQIDSIRMWMWSGSAINTSANILQINWCALPENLHIHIDTQDKKKHIGSWLWYRRQRFYIWIR